MKIKEIEISNFRAYKREKIEIDLEKDIILIYGNNGYGKTSFFDSIEWGITGKIKRFEDNLVEASNFKFLKNRFSSSLEGKVKVTFTDNFYIERKVEESGKEDYKNNKLEFPKNNIDIYKKIFVDEEKSSVFNESFNFLYLLSQELITDFIKRDTEQERYRKISNLFGMIEENKYKNIFSEKTKETKEYLEEIKEEINILNKKKNEYESLAITNGFENIDKDLLLKDLKLKDLKRENNIKLIKLQDLIKDKESKLNILKDEIFYKKELEDLKKLKDKLTEKKFKLNDLIKYKQIKIYENLLEENKINKINLIKIKIQLQSILNDSKIFENLKIYFKKNKDRKYYIENIGLKITEDYYNDKENIRINELVTMSNEIKSKIKIEEEEVKKNEEILRNSQELEELFYEVSKKIIESKKIEDYCPLCLQGVEDIKMTLDKLRLKENETLQKIQDIIESKKNKINILKKNHEELSKKIDIKIEKGVDLLLEEEEKIKKITELNENIAKIDKEKDIVKLNLKLSENEILLEKERLEIIEFLNEENYKVEIKKIEDLIVQKENIKLKKYVEISKQEILEKLENELIGYRLELKEKEILEIKYQNLEKYLKNLENHEEINILSQKIIQKEEEKKICEKLNEEFKKNEKILKKYIEDQTEKKFEDYKESISRLYSILNPHKKFNNIDFLSSRKKVQNSKLTLQIKNENLNIESNPAYILSSAQSNNLALAIFLGVNLTSKTLKLNSIFLDDPIQNMDDINIYSFTEIIKQMTLIYNKQIFISTHDDRVANYIKNKFKGKIQIIQLCNYGEIKKIDDYSILDNILEKNEVEDRMRKEIK